jgi:hypothetical protein
MILDAEGLGLSSSNVFQRYKVPEIFFTAPG